MPIDRRRFLAGGFAIVASGSALLASCAASDDSADRAPSTTGSPTTTSTSVPVSCEVTPEQIEGPYYLDLDMVRRDITEGKPGVPLTLTITIVDTARCAVMADVPVDIWHCDASGTYSGYGGLTALVPSHAEPVDGLTFLRGTQLTDADGRCTFETIVPGWYTGRAVHIHTKAHPTDTTQATTQLYFDDSTLDGIYTAAPYAERDGTFIPFSKDILRPGQDLVLDLQSDGSGYKADFTLGIKSE